MIDFYAQYRHKHDLKLLGDFKLTEVAFPDTIYFETFSIQDEFPNAEADEDWKSAARLIMLEKIEVVFTSQIELSEEDIRSKKLALSR